MKRARFAAIAFCAMAGLSPAACRRGESEPPRPPSAALDGEAGAPHDATVDAGTGSGLAMRPWLDDPRLAAVRAALRARDARSAATAAEDAATKPGLASVDSCAFSYISGRLAGQAGDFVGSKRAYARAAADACALAPYAKIGVARGALVAHAFEEAEKVLATVVDVAAHDEVAMLRADALALSGRRKEALPLWRKVLEGAPKGPHWAEAAGRLASALADGDAGDAAASAPEAYALATRVILEAPGRAEAYGARATRARAAALAKLPVELTVEERVGEARGTLEAGDPHRALSLAQALVTDPRATPKVACGAAMVRAQAVAKTAKSAPQADAWGDAMGKCGEDPELVTALYSGAKASASAKRPQEALFRFGEVEKKFPAHRLADDAALRGAMVVDEEGDRALAIERLSRIADTYPDGDMRGEGLFRAALLSLRGGDGGGADRAAALLARVDELFPDDRHWATAGRASFFRARLLERRGDSAGAKKLDQEIVLRAPLSFYMGRAYARLAEVDLASARAHLGAVVERDSRAPFAVPARTVIDSPAFKRAVSLIEVADVENARRELVAAGALGESAAPELVWLSGELFDRIGAWDTGHGVSRGRVKDHLAHLPEGDYRKLWETAYPRAYPDDVAKATATYGVSPALVWGIMREESSFIADVRSPANAYGLMQLIPSTAKWVSDGAVVHENDLKRPEVSVDLGTKLLGKLLVTHKHPALAIAAYNAGSGAVGRWTAARGGDDLETFVEEIPYEETRNYVKRVMGSMAAYAYLYDRAHLEDVLRVPTKVTR